MSLLFYSIPIEIVKIAGGAQAFRREERKYQLMRTTRMTPAAATMIFAIISIPP